MLFGGYIISSLSLIISCHSLSNTFSYGKHRVAKMFQKVNKQFYPKYNYFLLVSTVIIVNILLHVLLCLYHFIISIYDCLLSTVSVNHSLSHIYM